MLKVGDKIVLKKPMGALTNIGEICEVIDIDTEGCIHFRFGNVHKGCMSKDELNKYFNVIKKEKTNSITDCINIMCQTRDSIKTKVNKCLDIVYDAVENEDAMYLDDAQTVFTLLEEIDDLLGGV